MTMWMVRAGRGAAFIEEFVDRSVVAIGWDDLGEIPNGLTREQMRERVAQMFGPSRRSKVPNVAGQIYRFLNEMRIGDRVLTYDSGRRVFVVGTITSDAVYDPGTTPELPRVRKVTWEGEVPRDTLSTRTRNSLGAISTLFKVPDEAEGEILNAMSGAPAQAGGPSEDDVDTTDEELEQELLDRTREQSRELIKDRINRLDAYELQDLVAGVLRAMGYKTNTSPPGADRGVDILASRDGFGFEPPRIVVECKHRPSTAMGAQAIRSFLGGRHKDDKGLYVSTGGFSKEARYEAERASIPLTLMDLDGLVDAVVEHYEQVDSDTRVLLPLVKLFWPAG